MNFAENIMYIAMFDWLWNDTKSIIICWLAEALSIFLQTWKIHWSLWDFWRCGITYGPWLYMQFSNLFFPVNLGDNCWKIYGLLYGWKFSWHMNGSRPATDYSCEVWGKFCLWVLQRWADIQTDWRTTLNQYVLCGVGHTCTVKQFNIFTASKIGDLKKNWHSLILAVSL